MRSIVSKQVGSCEQVYFCKSSCNLLVDWYRFLQYAGVRLLTTMLHVNCISCHEFFLRSSCPKKEKKKKKAVCDGLNMCPVYSGWNPFFGLVLLSTNDYS